MSQSPTGEGSSPDGAYLDAWRDLAVRIRDGGSFSGHERNKAFLNCGSGARFADVSAAVGLDVADDGRGMAVADWDYDGDPDLWTSNRSGPRVRYFENRSGGNAAGEHRRNRVRFIAFRLRGNPESGCNRDAIGGRVELALKKPPAAREHRGVGRQVATLRAGDAFLSQSSKWLHFGIPVGAEIDHVEVRWPSGKPTLTRHEAVEAGGFYHLSQTSPDGKAKRWTPPARAHGTPESAIETAGDGGSDSPASAIRIRLSDPSRSPPIPYLDADGEPRELMRGPVLVKLFATWCPNCAGQLKALGASAAAIRGAGLEILPLCVDRLDPEFQTSKEGVQKHLDKLGFSIAAGWADEETVQRLDGLQRPLFYRQRRLPLPSAFLFDRRGALTVVYKGNFEVSRLMGDLKLLEADSAAAEKQALPFPGRSARDHFVTHPIATAKVFNQGGYPDDARRYLIAYLAKHREPENTATEAERRNHNRRMGDVHTLLGIIEAQQGDRSKAIDSLETAIALAPEILHAHLELVSLYELEGDLDKAAAHLKGMLQTNPDDPDVLTRLGSMLEKQGNPAGAAMRYRQALKAQPRSIPALNSLAWLLATTPERSVRNGAAALVLAKRLEQSPVRSHTAILDTIAAAYAASGDFTTAAQRARMALAAAEKSGDSVRCAKIRVRLEGYLKGKAVWNRE